MVSACSAPWIGGYIIDILLGQAIYGPRISYGGYVYKKDKKYRVTGLHTPR